MATILVTNVTTADESIGSGFGGIVTFTLTLSEEVLNAVTVGYRTLGGTATQIIDFPKSDGRITFAPGTTVQTLEIRVTSDEVEEPDEAFVLELFDPVNAGFEDDAPVLRSTAFILDDDGLNPTRTLFVSSPVLVEGDGGTVFAEFEITLSQPSATPLTYSYATHDGSAVAGSDYTEMSGEITFLGGQTVTSVRVPVSGDGRLEPSESFYLSVSPVSGLADGGLGATGTATILDDDAPQNLPTLSVAATDAWESIGSGFGGISVFTVTLSGPSVNAVSVDYRALPATATDKIDFPITSGTLDFAPGETSKTVEIRVASDSLDEVDEAYVLEFTDPRNAAFAGGAPVLRQASFVLDDDGLGPNRALHVSSPVVVEGDAGNTRVDFEVTLSRPADEELSFDYALQDGTAVAGRDYTAASGTLSFAPGQTTATVTVQVAGDLAVESAEFFQLHVTPGSGIFDGGTGATGTATILDDDAVGALPSVSLAATTAWESVGSGFGGNAYFTVTLSEASINQVSVDYRTVQGSAVAGTDFPSATGTVLFAPGETSQTVVVAVTSDSLDEADEAFWLELSEPENAALAGDAVALRATSFVLDDDGLGPNLAFAVSDVAIREDRAGGAATAEFVISLSRPQAREISLDYHTVNGSAVAGTDYAARSGTVTFAQGQTEAVVLVPILEDAALEGSERFFLSIDTPAGVFDSAFTGAFGTATITDNELGGGAGDDVLIGTLAAQAMWGRGGNDLMQGLGGSDTMRGGDGADTISGGAGHDLIYGGDTAADRRDVIYGGDGNDTIDGGYGNDELRGDAGNDVIAGGFGGDTVIGGAGNDTLTGSALGDELYGGDGMDFVNGGFGHDRVNGGAGADRFYHLGIFDHGSDWVQDYSAAEGDVLVFGRDATAEQFQVNTTRTAGAGTAGMDEAFVIYRPTGQIIWALIDGAGQDSINISLGGEIHDLLA